MFLLVTNRRDITTDFVILELQRRGRAYCRLNTEDFAAAILNWRPTQARWQLRIEGQDLDLSAVGAGYYRRPVLPEPPRGYDAETSAYAIGEWSAALKSLYGVIGDRWLNSPDRIDLAEDKPRQLQLASTLGFDIPETLVTNDLETARQFAAGGGFIGKPLRNALVKGRQGDRIVFTSRVDLTGVYDPDVMRAMPIILQREIPKRLDVRVTVVGRRVFAASIDSQSDPETAVDWRRAGAPDLPHAVHELPEPLSAQCAALTAQLGLRFGAIDLVLDPAGRYWFLEINPNGQWGWIQTRTGQPIAEAIADELEAIAR